MKENKTQSLLNPLKDFNYHRYDIERLTIYIIECLKNDIYIDIDFFTQHHLPEELIARIEFVYDCFNTAKELDYLKLESINKV